MNNANIGCCLKFLFGRQCVHSCLRKMAASLEEITEGRFRSPKTAEDESNLLKESIPKSTVYSEKQIDRSMVFTSGKLVEKLKFLFLIRVAPLKITVNCAKSSH